MTLSSYLRVCAILWLFFALVLRFAIAIPPLEGPDERNHIGYITDMRQQNRLPDPTDYESYLAFHESAQPPLYYLLVWGWSWLGPDYEWDGTVPLNIWVDQASSVPGDNRNQYLLGPKHIPHTPELQQAATWARFVSVLMGVLAVAVAWRASRSILPPGWAIFAVMIFAFNPVLIRGFAVAGNDAAALLLGTASVWGLLRLAALPLTKRRLFTTGLLMALAALSKASLLVFAASGVLVLTLRLYQDRRELLRALLLVITPLALLAAPWYAFNAIHYGDLMGTRPHLEMPWAFVPPRPIWEALRAEASILPSIWLDIGLPHEPVAPGNWARIVPLAAGILALGGGLRALWHRVRNRAVVIMPPDLIVMALLMIVAALAAAFVRWSLNFTAIGGRLVLPGYLALALLVALGMRSLNPPRALRDIFGVLTIFIALISALVIVPRAFSVVTMPPEQVPELEARDMLAFGEIEFLGYQIEPDVLTPDTESIEVMLCWQSLREHGLLEVPNSIVFAIIENGLSVGGRETYAGMGSYTLWEPGRAFCDRFTMPFVLSPQEGRLYNVMVGLHNPDEGGLLPDNFDRGLFVGHLIAPGQPLTHEARESALAWFDDVYLLNARMNRYTGNQLQIRVAWASGEEFIPRQLEAVYQLTDKQGLVLSEIVVEPGHDVYPSSMWEPNERIATSIVTFDHPQDEAAEYFCAQVAIRETEGGNWIMPEAPAGVLPADGLMIPLGCTAVNGWLLAPEQSPQP